MKKIISTLLLLVVLCALIPHVASNANAVEAQPVVSLATQQVGGGWPNGLCLGYIATIFYETYGIDGNIYSSCCAYQNGNRFIDSTSRYNIPVGACVYFGGSSVVCGCGNRAGHIAIHVGNDTIVHAWDGRIVSTSIDYVINCGYPYRGYGWYADVELSDIILSYATVAEGNYALKNKETGAYAVVENNTDVCGQNIIVTNKKEGFAITKSTTTDGYALRPLCSVGGKMNVYTDYVTSGNTVCLWDDTGHVSQRWNFEEVSGGYVIRSVQTPSCVLDVRENNDVYVSTYTGASSQIWVLEKFCENHSYDNACDEDCNVCGATRTTCHSYSAATCTKAKTCKACGATSGKKLGHDYEEKLTKATTAKDGKLIYKCTRCGYEASTSKTLYKVSSIKLSATSYTYNGKVKTPTVIVKDSKGSTLKKDTDYTVTYATGRKNAGTYTVTVKLKGNYSDTKTLTFKIKPISITKCSVKLSATSYTYNGKVKTPTVTVKNANGTKLKEGVHYTVTYATGRKSAGTYAVKVKLKGNYSGTKTLSFKIKPISITKCSVKLSATSYTYNGKPKTPTVTVKNANGTKLTKGTHYTVTYSTGRKHVGTYKVTIKMKGNYSGTKTLTFKIVPKAASVNKLIAEKKALTVKLNRQTVQSTGYQIQYSTSKSFSSYKTDNVTSNKVSTKTVSGLEARTTYYVRVRTYKTVSSTRIYSNWSSTKYLKTK